MRIQHNIAALNSYRNLTNNNSAVSKNLEKLSSGYRINRAGDDAAGLAISEKMRAQITGLETAQKNAQDGVSLVQTAEGALTEVHSMLNRMVELANQSANGTYDDGVDRANLQKEIQSLKDEIDRISEGTNFNGINLLDGSRKEAVAEDVVQTITGFPAVGATVGTNTIVHEAGVAEVKPEFSIDLSSLSYEVVAKDAANKVKVSIGGTAYELDFSAKDPGTITGEDIADALVTLINKNDSTVDAGTAGGTAGKNILGIKIGDLVYSAKADGSSVKFTLSETEVDGAKAVSQDVKGTDLTVDLTVSASSDNTDATKGVFKGTLNAGSLTITNGVEATDGTLANTKFNLTADQLVDGAKLTIGNETYVIKLGKDSQVTAGKNEKVIDMTDFEKTTDANYLDTAISRITVAAAGNDMFTVGSNASGVITLQEVTGGYAGKDADLTTLEGIKAEISLTKPGTLDADATKGLTLQIGDTSDDFNQLTVSIESMSTDSLGIGSIDISSQEGAKAAVDLVKAAINKVSSTRGDLGAIQNRLEHTINNLSVTTENMTAAESRIRDVDMAKEMMAYTKNNILVQSSQAMLAQANQIPQGVLQLLQ